MIRESSPRIRPESTRWQGFELSERELPNFIHLQHERIRSVWQREYERQEPFTIDTYRRINHEIGYFARNVLLLAKEWARSGDDSQKEEATTLLLQNGLNSIVATVDRVKSRHSHISVDWDNIIAESLFRAHRLIQGGEYPQEREGRRQIINQYSEISSRKPIKDSTPLVQLNPGVVLPEMEEEVERRIDLKDLILRTGLTFSKNQSAVFNLWIQEYNSSEIARILKKKPGYVRSNLDGAFNKLKKAI